MDEYQELIHTLKQLSEVPHLKFELSGVGKALSESADAIEALIRRVEELEREAAIFAHNCSALDRQLDEAIAEARHMRRHE